MGRVTDGERREAAERLRKISGLDYCKDPRYAVEICSDAIGADHGNGYSWDKMIARLADLIEPARGSGGRAILCCHCESMPWCSCEPDDLEGGCDFEPRVDEGEPPCNLYSLYEAVLRRRPRDELAIEDDEVRELVNNLLDICNAPGRDLIKACGAEAAS